MSTFKLNNRLNYRALTILGAFFLVFVSLLSTFNYFYNQDQKTAFAQNTPTNPSAPTLQTPGVTPSQNQTPTPNPTPAAPTNTPGIPPVTTPSDLGNVQGQQIVVTNDAVAAQQAGSNNVVVQSNTARTGGEPIIISFVAGLVLLGVIYYISIYGHSKKSLKTHEKKLKTHRR